jgi:hypothetical protein
MGSGTLILDGHHNCNKKVEKERRFIMGHHTEGCCGHTQPDCCHTHDEEIFAVVTSMVAEDCCVEHDDHEDCCGGTKEDCCHVHELKE